MLSSPVQRALETAGPIADALRLTVGSGNRAGRDRFRRLDGVSGSTRWRGKPAWAAWNRCRSLAVPPGGETMLAAQARAVAALMRAGRGFAGREVVMVSHQDVLKAVVAHVLGVSLDRLEGFGLDPASRTVVTLRAEGARVDLLNASAVRSVLWWCVWAGAAGGSAGDVAVAEFFDRAVAGGDRGFTRRGGRTAGERWSGSGCGLTLARTIGCREAMAQALATLALDRER